MSGWRRRSVAGLGLGYGPIADMADLISDPGRMGVRR